MRPCIRTLPLISALLACAASLAAGAAGAQQTVQVPRLQPRHVDVSYVPPPDTMGLELRVSEGEGREAYRATVASWTRLSSAETERLLNRLPPLKAELAASDSFAFPARTLPPPRAGNTVLAAFPPPGDAAPARPRPAGPAPLAVTRRAPEGEVPLGAEVTVTFSQPMVPLSSVGTVASFGVPARISPQTPGAWRWIDVRTLKFEPQGRLPMATEFTVEVPAGTPSLTGGRLAAAARWSFSTPAARATGGWPHRDNGEPAGLQPVLVVSFDQRVDPAAVVRTVRVTADGRDHPVRLATEAELAEADATTRLLVERQDTGRWVAFRPVRPLPRDREVRVVVAPGTPSLEGPRATADVQEWRFRTYGAFRVTGRRCGWGPVCRPGMPWTIALSSPVALADTSLVRVVPALLGMRVHAYGGQLNIHGYGRPGTRYTVSLSPAIRDVFGQALGATAPVAFTVGPPQAGLTGPGAGENVMVLDPAGPPEVSVFSHDHPRLRVRVHRVSPADWPAFARIQQRARPTDGRPALPGRAVTDREVRVDGALGETRETRVDLRPALAGGLGHAVVAVEALEGAEEHERRQAVYLWVQSTRIGLAAFADPAELTGWATSLVDGAPLSGVRLSLPGASRPAGGQTDARGLAGVPLPDTVPEHAYLLAERGGDAAFLPRGSVRGGWASWRRHDPGAHTAWHAFTDRNLYRPGEQVRFKGWVRTVSLAEGGQVGLEGVPAGDTVSFTVLDPRNNEIAKGTLALNALGGFDGSFRVPEGANLGDARVRLERRRAGGARWADDLPFQIQEFRRPEFTVSASATPGPHRVGESAEVTVRAAYLAGGALPGAPVAWEVTSQPGRYTPPGWSQWHFGPPVHFWWGHGDEDGGSDSRDFEGTTDASGAHAVRIDFDRARPPRPYAVRAEATVTDVNRQTWTASSDLLVHPADLYVGMKTSRHWIQRGDSLEVDLVVVDLDGKPAAGRAVEARAERGEWRAVDGVSRWVPSDSLPCVRTSMGGPVRCVFRPDHPGSWRVTAETRDERGRLARTYAWLWVMGDGVLPGGPQEGAGQRSVRLVPDRAEYAPGDTAKILVSLPFRPARGVATVRRAGLLTTEEFAADGLTHLLRVPITAGHVPNVYVQVDVVGGAAPAEDAATARGTDFGTGTVKLDVPPKGSALAVAALPADTALEPDAATALDVEVRDAAGRPVAGAEVAVVVVDEAVLALTGYQFANPLPTFYPERAAGVTDTRLHPLVRVHVPPFRPAPGTIVGTVVHSASGEPVSGALVRIEALNRETTTDAHGRFRLAVPAGTHRVTVARVGLATATLSVVVGSDAPPPVRVALGQDELEVQALVATGQGEVSRREIAIRGARTVAPEEAAMAAPAAMLQGKVAGVMADGARADGDAPIDIRTNFDALAVFSPAERTGADGRVRVAYKLPSNLTRYRVVAVAVEGGTRFGLGESAVTARQALMVRASPPRFLNFGDRFELPVVLQNQTGRAMEVSVAARGSGVSLHDGGRRVTVPAHDRVEVRLPGEAVRAGRAFLQVAAASGARADAAELSLPVWTPATYEAFAAYGSIAEGGVETIPLQVPGDAIPAFGGLEVTTSSTALHELTDAMLYLVRYPYGCAEQRASRILAVAALRDVLYAFKAEELPPVDSLHASMRRDIAALAALQNPDGGFGFWERGNPSWPIVSIHAAHALQRAREKGYEPPAQALELAMRYLRAVPANVPAHYPAEVKRALHAYALYVRDRMGDRAAAADARSFFARHARDLTLEEEGWLLSTLAGEAGARAETTELLRRIGNRATETASTATFATSYTEGEYLLLHSARRTDAIVLEALLAADAQSELVTKTVRGLLGHRKRGRWESTQENGWVLVALDRYFRAYEGQTPELVARVWLGERFAGEHAYRGRTADRQQVSVPMRVLGEASPDAVTIGKEGPGRLYWRAGLRYAPRDLDVLPLEAGFAVERSYEAVDDSADVTRGADGRWRVKAGARVRVTVTMTAPSRRVHVALVDPLPAGFEPVNPELRGNRTSPEDEPERGRVRLPAGRDDQSWWRPWHPWWHEHQNLRDDRAEAFTSLLPAGVYTYSYVARATTPGTFIVPPPRAEEMYSPETFGRGATDRVIVVSPEESGGPARTADQ